MHVRTQLTGDATYATGQEPTDAANVPRVVNMIPVLREHPFLQRCLLATLFHSGRRDARMTRRLRI